MVELDPAAAVVASTRRAIPASGGYDRTQRCQCQLSQLHSAAREFRECLQQADDAAATEGDFGQVTATPISAFRATGESVRLDLEISTSAENAMRYSMMLGMLDRKLQLMSLAVREGRAQ